MANQDIGDKVEHQLDELRSQLKHINKTLSDHGIDLQDMREEAGNIMQDAANTAREVVRYAQDEATTVVETARKAPAATTTVLTLAGALGFVAGYVTAMNAEGGRRRRWHW